MEDFLNKARRNIVIAESDARFMKYSDITPEDILHLTVKNLGCKVFMSPNMEVIDGMFKVDGTLITQENHPTGLKDLYFFKE